jgi:hypothetical protein
MLTRRPVASVARSRGAEPAVGALLVDRGRGDDVAAEPAVVDAGQEAGAVAVARGGDVEVHPARPWGEHLADGVVSRPRRWAQCWAREAALEARRCRRRRRGARWRCRCWRRVAGPPAVDHVGVAGGVLAAAGALERDLGAGVSGKTLRPCWRTRAPPDAGSLKAGPVEVVECGASASMRSWSSGSIAARRSRFGVVDGDRGHWSWLPRGRSLWRFRRPPAPHGRGGRRDRSEGRRRR